MSVLQKGDENEEPPKMNGDYQQNEGEAQKLPTVRSTPHATTRRAIAKSCMRFRVCFGYCCVTQAYIFYLLFGYHICY